MPYVARKLETASLSSSVCWRSGTFTRAMSFSSLLTKARLHSSDCLEQELENLDVTPRLRQIVAPSVQPMPAQQEAVGRRPLLQDRFDAAGQRRDVLVVFEDRHPLAVLMRAHPFETLQHLETTQPQAAL